jgi:hypothetical protein
MICGMTIGFLLVVGLVILIVGLVLGALVAVVGIEQQRKLEEGSK